MISCAYCVFIFLRICRALRSQRFAEFACYIVWATFWFLRWATYVYWFLAILLRTAWVLFGIKIWIYFWICRGHLRPWLLHLLQPIIFDFFFSPHYKLIVEFMAWFCFAQHIFGTLIFWIYRFLLTSCMRIGNQVVHESPKAIWIILFFVLFWSRRQLLGIKTAPELCMACTFRFWHNWRFVRFAGIITRFQYFFIAINNFKFYFWIWEKPKMTETQVKWYCPFILCA